MGVPEFVLPEFVPEFAGVRQVNDNDLIFRYSFE